MVYNPEQHPEKEERSHKPGPKKVKKDYEKAPPPPPPKEKTRK